MNEFKQKNISEPYNFQPNSKTGAIKIQKDGDISILGVKFGMVYQTVIQELSENYKIEYASSPDKNVVIADNICINPKATSCTIYFDFNPTTNTLESINLVSKYSTNFYWCFNELYPGCFIEYSEIDTNPNKIYLLNTNKIYWYNTGKCRIKVSCYSFESSGKTIEKQMATIVKQEENTKQIEPMKQQSILKNQFWRIIAIVALIAFCIIGYLNASRDRYRMVPNAAYVLDTWTGNIKNVIDQFTEN